MKILFIYQPEGADEPEWEVELDPERPRFTGGEALALERHCGDKPMGDVFAAAGEGHVTSMLAILWIMRKRSEPTLRYGDFEDSIVVDDLTVQVPEDDEKEAATKKDPKAKAVAPATEA